MSITRPSLRLVIVNLSDLYFICFVINLPYTLQTEFESIHKMHTINYLSQTIPNSSNSYNVTFISITKRDTPPAWALIKKKFLILYFICLEHPLTMIQWWMLPLALPYIENHLLSLGNHLNLSSQYDDKGKIKFFLVHPGKLPPFLFYLETFLRSFLVTNLEEHESFVWPFLP